MNYKKMDNQKQNEEMLEALQPSPTPNELLATSIGGSVSNCMIKEGGKKLRAQGDKKCIIVSGNFGGDEMFVIKIGKKFLLYYGFVTSDNEKIVRKEGVFQYSKKINSSVYKKTKTYEKFLVFFISRFKDKVIHNLEEFNKLKELAKLG